MRNTPAPVTPRTGAGRALLKALPEPEFYGDGAKWWDAILAIEREAAAPAATHTHDLRIGAREYEDGYVRAWQVYCVICDEAGRIVLPEREAAAPAATMRLPGKNADMASIRTALASPEPTPDSGLDVERLAEALEASGVSYEQPPMQDAQKVAAEYARLSSVDPSE